MICWRAYFPLAQLVGWEYYPEKIEKALKDRLPYTYYIRMDVNSESSVVDGFNLAQRKFDIIIDDSTHEIDDQVRLLKYVHKYLKPGGYFIIEDVFRDNKEDDYEAALMPYAQYYSAATFIEAEHILKHSGSRENDKLLVLVRNATPCGS
jgi:SAM-dependent methyltransferase